MLWEKLTVEEHFELFGLAYGLSEEERERSVSALLEELQFGKYRSYRIEELSGGTRTEAQPGDLADARAPAAAARRALLRASAFALLIRLPRGSYGLNRPAKLAVTSEAERGRW
jgi:ABC-type proline/glycine betaine transport system ATPase subunit